MNKWREWIGSFISLIIFLSLALITAIFSEYLSKTSTSAYENEGPSASLSNVLIGQTEQNGQLQSHLSAKLITFDVNNEATLTRPILLLYEGPDDPIYATSDTATLNSEGDIIRLKTNVKISRKSSLASKSFEILANNTTFDLKSKTAYSDGPVKIKTNLYELKGIGMKINQSNKIITILNDASLNRK
ncbi:MAG: LPS export ABC transporter periplasmic protein LptC [Betaproteobacteria bacterium TMED156]|nr:MAG: LPS export ABC transporter periplasmic protein LptC [Betaproteobacteria bacterium TMED156]